MLPSYFGGPSEISCKHRVNRPFAGDIDIPLRYRGVIKSVGSDVMQRRIRKI